MLSTLFTLHSLGNGQSLRKKLPLDHLCPFPHFRMWWQSPNRFSRISFNPFKIFKYLFKYLKIFSDAKKSFSTCSWDHTLLCPCPFVLNGCWHPFVWQFNIQFLSSETEEALCQCRGLAQSKSSDYILEKKNLQCVLLKKKLLWVVLVILL